MKIILALLLLTGCTTPQVSRQLIVPPSRQVIPIPAGAVYGCYDGDKIILTHWLCVA